MILVRVGDLKHRVTIQSVTRTRDLHGGVTETWANTATVWAKVEPQGGSKSVRESEYEHKTSHKVTVRYRPDLTADDRLDYGGRILQIVGLIDMEEARQYQQMQCREA